MARIEILSAVNQPPIENSKQSERTSNFGPQIIDNIDIPTRRGTVDVVVNQPALRSYLIEQFGKTFPDSGNFDITPEIDKLTISFGKYPFRETVSNHSRNTCLAQGVSSREADKEAFISSVAIAISSLLDLGASPRSVFWFDEKAPLLYFDIPQILCLRIRKGKDPNKFFSEGWDHEL